VNPLRRQAVFRYDRCTREARDAVGGDYCAAVPGIFQCIGTLRDTDPFEAGWRTERTNNKIDSKGCDASLKNTDP